MAWQSHGQAMQEAHVVAQRTVGALHEHALRALETSEVLLRLLDRQIEGRSWDDIERDTRLQRDIAELTRAKGSLASISFVDVEGRVRLHTHDLPFPDTLLATTPLFHALQQRKSDLVIGTARVGGVSGQPRFPMGLRRSTEDGQFDGAVIIGVSLEHFTDFWRQFAPTVAHVIPLMREDGELLVRYPASSSPHRLSPDGPFMRHIALAPSGVYTAVSQVDGIERTNAYTRIGPYPLYVSFSLETRAIVDNWRRGLILPAWMSALAVCILLILSVVLTRYVAREQKAVENWRDTARQLSAEMSRREAAETSLRQAQKIETIGQITGGVAHDFNNLLQVLSNNLQLAARTARESPTAAGYITSAISTVERGAKLTHQLLAFSRRQPLSPQPVDMSSMLENIAALASTTVGSTVQVDIEVSADTWPAMVDRNQAEMAILNLAINARDAMPGGGSLTITAHNVSVPGPEAQTHSLTPGEYVVVSVSDTGTGMTAEVAERAFEPFFTTKDVGSGSGLGLSQVYGFATQSGGTVQIQNRSVRGTMVRLYLPRAHQRVPASAPAQQAPTAATRLTILLLDDDAEVRSGIAAELKLRGHQVLEAGSGPEGLTKLREHPEVTLLISDYAMPGMRGTLVAAEATRLRPDLKVLLISGFVDMPDKKAFQWSLLRKPFTPDELAARIAQLTEAMKSSAAPLSAE